MAKKAAPKAAEKKSASVPLPAPALPRSVAKSATKAEIYDALAEKTGLGKKDVASVFSALEDLIGNELGKKGPGLFTLPGLLKLKVVRRPATKAKQGINPFTKQPMMIKAKPASNLVKALPLKGLKELA